MAKIVVVGSFNMDLTAYMSRMPQPGETVSGHQFVTGPGGKGSNQAVAAARLGANVTFIGRVGQDAFGDQAVAMWRAEGINTDYVLRDKDHATGVAPIWVDETGENMIVVVLGANLAITKSDIKPDVIAAADTVIVQLEINLEIVAYTLKLAHEKGVRTILNPAPAVHLPDDILKLADFITPNETELAILTGASGDVTTNARSLLKRDGQTVIVTMGAQGAQYVTDGDSALISTFNVEAVDTTGAGDAFNGALALALSEGKTLTDAIRFANATAALCVTKPGTSASMPTRDQVEQLLR